MQLKEEAYQAWLNQSHIQFPLHPYSQIRNSYNNNNSSHVGNGGNETEVGMDAFLRDIGSMDTILLDEL